MRPASATCQLAEDKQAFSLEQTKELAPNDNCSFLVGPKLAEASALAERIPKHITGQLGLEHDRAQMNS